MRPLLLALTLLLCNAWPAGSGSSHLTSDIKQEADRRAEDAWVTQQLDSLTLDERIGQLLMIRAHSNLGPAHEAEVARLIREYHAGGVIFFQGTAERQAMLTNQYQALAKRVPLLVAIDGEWGLGMRLKTTTLSYPRQLTLGAIQDNRLIYQMGQQIAEECRRVGVQVNFAPVIDVNNNPLNPVINDRSFGEDRYNVTAKSYMYMKGLQDGQVLASAKHFPGHGDTDVDSHYDLPVIHHDRDRLDSVELFPFRVLAQHNAGSMMIAHLAIPALDSTPNLPASLSPRIIDTLLLQQLGFQGLVFTDGLEMEGVRKYHRDGELEVKALLAGNDILLLPQDVPTAVRAIKAALDNGRLSEALIDHKVRKILRTKYRLGLTEQPTIELEGLHDDLNSPKGLALKRKLYEAALTAVRNDGKALPIARDPSMSVATLSLGMGSRTDFQRHIDTYVPQARHYNGALRLSKSRMRTLVNTLKSRDVVIIGLHRLNKKDRTQFGLSANVEALITELQQHTTVVTVLFGSPYALKHLDAADHLVVAYQDEDLAQEVAAKALFGGARITGRLPITASAKSPYGAGVNVGREQVLQYASPDAVGMNARVLSEIDAIAKEAIAGGAMPGLQVLIAKDNQIVYHKSFGHHAYDGRVPMRNTDIFDLASVTKICAATVSVMKLVDEGRVDLDQTLGTYIPRLRGSNKEDLIIRDVMAHQARLKAWIPFYKETVIGRKNPTYVEGLYRSTPDDTFSLKVTDQLYLRHDYADTIYQRIIDSPLRSRRGYKYSDLGFYLMRDLVESVTNVPFEEYVQTTFYQPMGLTTMGYNPTERFDVSRMPPTEEDDYFRNGVVQGYVHDMGAAMLNGVSGHAGLFASPKDVAGMLQMLLNNGSYNGREFFKPATIAEFTTRHPNSRRRGIGFDMKDLGARKMTHVTELASSKAFGHLGFTGISAWADPQHNLIFVFCSNRTYPSMNNRKIVTMDIRPRMQAAAYRALE